MLEYHLAVSRLSGIKGIRLAEITDKKPRATGGSLQSDAGEVARAWDRDKLVERERRRSCFKGKQSLAC